MIVAKLVTLVHAAFIAFVVLVPLLSKNEYLLTYHFVIVPMLMVHWLTNNNVCALTQLEAFASGVKDTNETFLGKFINPVYDVKDEVVWMITGFLWLLTALKLRQHHFQFLKNIFTKMIPNKE